MNDSSLYDPNTSLTRYVYRCTVECIGSEMTLVKSWLIMASSWEEMMTVSYLIRFKVRSSNPSSLIQSSKLKLLLPLILLLWIFDHLISIESQMNVFLGIQRIMV